MKLHLEKIDSINNINSYGNGFITVNDIKYSYPIFFSMKGNVQKWVIEDVKNITSDDIILLLKNYNKYYNDNKKIIDYGCDMLLIGTGNYYENISNKILLPIYKSGISVEIMNTRSAIYTYNLLVSQDRNVTFAAIPLKNEIL